MNRESLTMKNNCRKGLVTKMIMNYKNAQYVDFQGDDAGIDIDLEEAMERPELYGVSFDDEEADLDG